MSNIETQQILVTDLAPRMAFFLFGGIWEVETVVVSDNEDNQFDVVLKDPNNFVDTRIPMSLDRRLGCEIVTWDGNQEYRKSYRYDEVSASDKALDALREKLTGTPARRPLPIDYADQPLAQWERNLLEGRDVHDDGTSKDFDCCAPDTELGREDENPAVTEQELNTTDHNAGKELCYDDWSGRYFYGSMNVVDQAVNRLNSIITEEGEATLNDYYDIVGLTGLPMGTDFGWSGAHVILTYGSFIAPNGKPCISVSFRTEPKPALGQYGR